MKIFVVNPGSTSTKIALCEDEKCLWADTQRYDAAVIERFGSVMEQEGFRFDAIMKALESKNVSPGDFAAVVGRGGLMKPARGGTYIVNQLMLDDLRNGTHASNLGAPLAVRFARAAGNIPAFIVDPVVVDELADEARLSGLPEMPRVSIFHALNQKAVARRAAAELKKPLTECGFVVAHMGGGVSVGAHERGRVIDVNNALDGDGPMSPERSGSLPSGGLISLCFSGRCTLEEVEKKINGRGGLVAHLGTNDLREVEKRIEAGDSHAALVFEALCLQCAKEIGRCAAVLKGRVDAIVLTGGLAYSDRLCAFLTSRTEFIAPVLRYPGEDEMRALAEGALRVLRGEEPSLEYGAEGIRAGEKIK
ncbi:MAG: butyrate kinase [Synergistaceae bacterium]|jgi:butyrate kinase|nr:butyrate kinase [Synergistaceae bacterium]